VTSLPQVPRVLVAGIGNILLQDDGFGPQAISRLQREYEFGNDVELLDIGTPALDFVDYLAGREVVILLDALSSGGEPGEVVVYHQEQLRQFLPGMRLSAHQPCLHETLFAAEASGIQFKEVILIGLVGSSFDVDTVLSSSAKRGMSDAIAQVCHVLKRHGVTTRRRKKPPETETWWTSPSPVQSIEKR
jgi:hydrogenase maturation protease